MTTPFFSYEPDDENPGWHSWTPADLTRFNGFMGKLLVRAEGEARARVRMMPGHRHSNVAFNVHGGVLLAFADVALFAASHALGVIDAGRSVTLDLSAQFIGASKPGTALDAEVELLRETRRLLFLRGLIVQADETVMAFAATIRKPAGTA